MSWLARSARCEWPMLSQSAGKEVGLQECNVRVRSTTGMQAHDAWCGSPLRIAAASSRITGRTIMKHHLHRLGWFVPAIALAGVLYGGSVVAQTTNQVQTWPPAASVPALQARMKSIRETSDPAQRMTLMEEQVKALDAATQGASAACPMMGGQMGGQMGAAPMRKGAGPGPMGGMMMDPQLMQEHMKMMKQHMGMMENMMKMHPGTPPATPN
jgi:hypothetical protein